MGATAASAGDSPFMPRENSRADYIRGFSLLAAENGLEGIFATAWDDGSPHLETVMRGLIAQGEFGWNPTARTIEDFKHAHAQREFGFRPDEDRTRFVDDMEKAVFFFDSALVTEGRRNPAWGVGQFTLLELPDKENPGAWSEKFKNKIAAAKEQAQLCSGIAGDITEAKKNALRNRYTLRVYEQTNNLIAYPAKLILALHSYDMACDDAARKIAADELLAVSRSFYSMRAVLEAVYSETRFMSQPEEFLPDMNHHNHLAAKTAGSDWLFLYELPMVKSVEAWLDN